ncbi:MAG: diguanylate cyclase [Pseudomonadales bacterium]
MDDLSPDVSKVVVVLSDDTPAHFYDDALAAFPDRITLTGAVEGLQYLERNPASVLVVEYDLSELNGAEVAETIRDIDADRGHFTYVIVTLDEAKAPDCNEDGESPIDKCIHRHDTNLIHAFTLAGTRLSSRINQLLAENGRLQQHCGYLEQGQLLDPVTGMGNRRFAEQTLARAIRQVESRGGAVCFLSICVENYTDVVNRYDERIGSELMAAVADRINHLVRPLDTAANFDPGEFALILVQPTIDQCTAACYQRIFDGIRLKSYKTPAGFLDVKIAMSVCAATAESGAPDPDMMIRTTRDHLEESSRRERIVVTHLTSGL